MLSLMLPQVNVPGWDDDNEQLSRRVAEALTRAQEPGQSESDDQQEELEIEATLTYSDQEVLRKKDFEAMSADEIARAKKAIANLRLPIQHVPTRRFRADDHGQRIDMRATLRMSLRGGSEVIPLQRRRRIYRPPPLVVLCDISGSMSRYSRMFLHFLHVITNDRDRVHTFLFGTRLDNVTRYLRHKDVDVALAKISEAVEDWDGGTRIGACLKEFNTAWSRRVLAQGALVLLISDGLDRDAASGLEAEADRLHKSCRRLIWLNPLLRYAGFEAKSLGIRALLPHVDEFRPVHNLASLTELAAALGHGGAVSDQRDRFEIREEAA